MADPITVWSSFRASPEASTVMSPLELDGYMTGLVVTPQAAPIPPSAWMDRLWGDDEPLFADQAQINARLRRSDKETPDAADRDASYHDSSYQDSA